MKSIPSVLLLSAAPLIASAADAPRPRGVGPDFAKYYKDTTSFACIFNPTIKLLPSQINDDFCDCPDGSDEPGTAACSYVSPKSSKFRSDSHGLKDVNTTAALPGFYCKNKGHQPGYISFQHVNDGVCDHELCCDGSDEWAKVGGASCTDKCKEIGKEWRRLDEARQKSMTAALKKKAELIAESTTLRKEVEDKVDTLKTQIQAQVIKVKDLEIKLVEAETKAKGKVVKDTGKGGKLGVFVGLAKARVEELRKNLVTIRGHRDAAKERLEELETILISFKEEYNPNFNDEGVKRAVRAWEDYVAKDKPNYEDSYIEQDLEAITREDTDTEGMKWGEWKEEKSDTDLLYEFEAYLPESLRSWVDARLRDLRLMLISNGIIAGTDINNDTVDPAVKTAREQSTSANSELDKMKKDLTTSEEDLEKDYGPDSIFRALKGKCVSTEAGEYVYELCWFDRTKQKPKKGGGETNMGNFVSLETIVVDDEVRADGKGVGSGERLALRHENGQHCWNGPNRSTLVILACSEVDEIWKVAEEEKCVYRMEVGSPAACQSRAKKEGGADQAKAVKDEL